MKDQPPGLTKADKLKLVQSGFVCLGHVSQYCRSEESGLLCSIHTKPPPVRRSGNGSVSPDPLGDRRGGPFAKLQWHYAQQFPFLQPWEIRAVMPSSAKPQPWAPATKRLPRWPTPKQEQLPLAHWTGTHPIASFPSPEFTVGKQDPVYDGAPGM